MGTIESKVLKLQELSKEKMDVNQIAKDIADILGNSDINEKKQIAEMVGKTNIETVQQKRNLQFIVPHVVKELYEYEGREKDLNETITKKKEDIAKKKVEPVETVSEPVEQPIVEPVEPIIEEPIAEPVSEPVVEPVVEFIRKPEPKIIPNRKMEEIEDAEIVESNEIVEPIENTETENSKSKKTDTPYAAKSMTGYLNKDIHEATDENRWLTFKIGDPVTLINYGGERKYCGKITGFFREENKDENETPKECFIFTERWNKESNKRPVYIGSFEKATPKEIRTWFWIQKLRNTIRPKNTEEKIQIQEEKVKKIAEEKALLQKKIDEAEKNQKK